MADRRAFARVPREPEQGDPALEEAPANRAGAAVDGGQQQRA
jgi:hypothetical protein